MLTLLLFNIFLTWLSLQSIRGGAENWSDREWAPEPAPRERMTCQRPGIQELGSGFQFVVISYSLLEVVPQEVSKQRGPTKIWWLGQWDWPDHPRPWTSLHFCNNVFKMYQQKQPTEPMPEDAHTTQEELCIIS